MCNIWIHVNNVYYNEVRKNFNHYHLTELNRKEKLFGWECE